MHKGANKQTNKLNKNGNDISVLALCYQTFFEKKSSNICATRIRNKINKELDKKASNDMFSLRRLILISAPA